MGSESGIHGPDWPEAQHPRLWVLATWGTFKSRRDTKGVRQLYPSLPLCPVGIGCNSEEAPVPRPGGLKFLNPRPLDLMPSQTP